jgi:chemotaxis protein MotA
MDFATIVGIVAAFGVVLGAILIGGTLAMFYDLPSVLIVIGGAAATTLIRFRLVGVLHALAIGGKVACTHSKVEARDLIEEIAGYADLVRKQGALGLENAEASIRPLAKGLQMIADGFEPAIIREYLEKDRDQYLDSLDEGRRVFKALADSAPAFGMIGTLVGLVQMLANMSDPKSIGPAMAVALLTTLYGALIANVLCIPVYEKLDAKAKNEDIAFSLVIDGITMIREQKSAQVVRDMLLAYLPEKHRQEMQDAA